MPRLHFSRSELDRRLAAAQAGLEREMQALMEGGGDPSASRSSREPIVN